MNNNSILSNYEIKETIGAGSFSVVKLGINKFTKEKIAIKILRKKEMQREEDKSRLEREINILKKLHHINIIKIFKIEEEQNKCFMIMEYCENRDLFNYIVAHQKLSEEETAYFFYQLINGLDYIHHNNIVHRDLKPENLLLSKGNILKIIDFGISCYYFPKKKLLSTPCGSPHYASPEMVLGNKYSGRKIDIWSCGIIIYVMICGYLPFEAPSSMLLFRKIVECKVDYPDFVSDDAIDIMNKILEVDPYKRINIEQIKKHPFYLKGKNEFEKMHKDLIEQVEFDVDKKDMNDIEKDIINNINYKKTNNNKIHIKKSKSSNSLKDKKIKINYINNNLYLFQIKKRLEKYKLEKNILNKENIINNAKLNSKIHFIKNEFIKDSFLKKFKIINDKNKKNSKIAIKEINFPIKEIANYSFKNIEEDFFKQKFNKEKIYSDIYNLSNLTSFKTPHYNCFRNKYSDMDIKKKKTFYPHSRNKGSINLLNKILNQEKLKKFIDVKKEMIQKKKKDKGNLSNVVPLSLNKSSETFLQNKLGFTNKVSKKVQKNLEIIKYDINTKNMNDLFLYKNKNFKKLWESNTTKNIGIIDKNINIMDNFAILNNNHNDFIDKNINAKNIINNIRVYSNPNSPKIPLIKDVKYLHNMDKINNFNLAKINKKSLKENKAIKSLKDINTSKIIKSKYSYDKDNNTIIPRILLTKVNSDTNIINIYSTPNIKKMYLNAIEKRIREINGDFSKNSKKKIINRNKSYAYSIYNNIKNNNLIKKMVSERIIRSYDYGN